MIQPSILCGQSMPILDKMRYSKSRAQGPPLSLFRDCGAKHDNHVVQKPDVIDILSFIQSVSISVSEEVTPSAFKKTLRPQPFRTYTQRPATQELLFCSGGQRQTRLFGVRYTRLSTIHE